MPAPYDSRPYERTPAHERFALNGRRITGLASSFGTLIDAFEPTLIARGAYRKTLLERRDKVAILWMHDQHDPIGKLVDASEKNRGLEVTVELTPGVQQADEALRLISHGALDSFSIGFDPIRTQSVTWDRLKEFTTDRETLAAALELKRPVRVIQEVRLVEISPYDPRRSERPHRHPLRETAKLVAGRMLEIDGILADLRRRETLNRKAAEAGRWPT